MDSCSKAVGGEWLDGRLIDRNPVVSVLTI